MNIEQLRERLNVARKSKYRIAVDALSAVISAIQEHETRQNIVLDESGIFNIIEKESVKYSESADCYLRSKNTHEESRCRLIVLYLQELLPSKVPIDEYPKIVEQYVSQFEPIKSNMGKILGLIKADYGTTIDMKTISSLVKEKLN